MKKICPATNLCLLCLLLAWPEASFAQQLTGPSLVPGGNAPVGQLQVGAAESHQILGQTASFSFDATMHNVFVGAIATPLTANVVATLPQCVTALKGRTYGLKKMDSSTYTVTLTAATTNAQTGTADLIDGQPTVLLSSQFAQTNEQCDGAGNWVKGFY